MTPAATLGLRSAWVAVIVVLSGIVTGIHDCYDSQRREYVGNSTELATCTDCECLPWPPEYGFPENYCRFVEGSDIPRLDIPRCLVDNYLGVHLEDCNVPSCDVHTTCYRDDGSDYRDGGEFTESGYQCLQWDNVQDRGVNSTMFPLADLTENYCRNPDGESRPWCYFLANGTIQKGYCAIAHCTSGSALLFDQLQLHTLVWDASSVVETVSFKPAQFTVETCLQTCADNKDFKCRSVIVDTLRRSCLLNDVNQFFVNLLETERFDFYLRKDTVCDVFEITDLGQTECLLPIGVEVGLIQDAQLSASSYASDDHAPWAGRLNGPSSWMPDTEEFNSSAEAEARPYIQIDFLEIMKVTGLMVQGGGGNDSYYGNWVEEFIVLVTHDPVGGVWDKVGVYTDTVTEFGPVAPKIFPANREANCIQTILFDEAVFTRYLRINPTKWHGQVALRVEVIGCRDNGCDNSLGMINGQIADSQLGVSTYFNPNCAEGAARLDPFYFEQSCGWKARPLGYVDSTMTIRLGRPHVVTSIVTQGCEDGRVTSFRVSHVNKNLNRVAVPEDISVTEVIGGNSQASYLYRHTLSSPVECTAIYITILEWVGMACLKVELVGCLSLSGCRQRLGMESGRIADHQISTESVNRTGSSLTVSATPRLHQWVGLSSGWNLEYSTGAEWLQIDLLTLHTVTGFIVQAGREHQYSLWVDTYLLLYAADRAGADGLTTETWRPYVDKEGVTMTFRGSHSPYTISHHTLYRSFIARKIRIKPVSWSSLYPGLRAEVIGCELADHGDFCSENTTRYKGFCLGVANRDEAWTCDAVFAHHATQVVIHSAPMQQAVVNVLQNSELQTYLIGLRIVASSDEPSYTWLDGSVITYNNFDPSIQIPYTSNSSEVLCVKVNTAHDFHWEVTTCDGLFFNSRGTVCQYDLDECAGNHGCSHECLNYPGGYQCQCPTGYVLDSETRKDCIPVCSNYTDSGSTWNQRGKWCYTEGAENATWHDATSACLSLGAGIRLPTMDDAFWADFDGAWNLTWVSMGNAFLLSETNPSFRQDSPQMYQNSSFETNCTAIDLSVRPFEVQEWVGSCNWSLPYVCIMEFASLEDLDDGSSFITAETPLGYFRSWHYPPHLESDHIRTELRFSLPENYTVRFDISYLAIPQSEEFEENSFAIFEILPDSNVSVRRAFFRGAQKRGVSVIGSGSEVQAVFNVSSFHPWHGDPSVVGIETLFTVVECASNCRSYCGSSPSILTNATGSFGILNTLLDMYARCRWLISLEKGKFVRLRLREYDLSNNSRVSVIYGNVPEGDYRTYDVDMRGGTRPFFIADTNEVTVFLITTGVQEDSGFWMDYDSVDSPGCNVGHTAFLCSDFAGPCDTDISCNYQSAYIATKAYPGSLSASTTATWQIQTPPGTFVEIVFEHINIPSVQQSTCTNGYITLLEVIDELDPDTIVEGLCNVNLPTGALRSKQNRVRLELRTAYDTSDNMFLAKYEGLHFQSRREVVVTSDHCETGWFYFNQHCYRLSDSETLIRWDDANTRCGREDATLVSMRDRDEAEYVHYMLTTEWFTTRTNTYIGLTNRNLQGVFTWSDKSPMSYTDWALTYTEEEEEEEEIERFEYNSPNGGSLESCTMIKLEDFSTSANWVDVACAAREAYQYLCKKEAEDFTQPASIGDFVGQDHPRQCPQHLFQCSTGECIQRIFLCDSAVDCSDGSDEGAVCSTGLDYARFKFQCEPREVSASLVCDFIQDCDQGADERNCLRAECDTTQFQCQNGQCIDLSKRCDLINPCSEDTPIEGNGCELITGGFQCYSSRWIPVEYQCDSFPDCGGLHYEDEIPCQDKYVASCESDNVIPCRSGICVDQNHTCIYDFDRHGYIQGCRDVTHLRDCESFQCPEMMFKCPDSYCIPIRLRCDNVFDCPNKEDEKQCDEYICPGAYRCRNHEQCVSLDQLCDGKPDCPGHENDRGGDDELFCNVSCPASCECVGLSYVCESTEWGPGAASMISTKVRQLFLNSVALIGAASNLDNGSTRRKRDQIPASDTVMDKLFLNFSHYPLLVDLELKDNGITELSPGMFNNSHSIRTLDLSLNNIDVLRSGTFQGLSSLENLSLSGNSLSNIEVGAFAGLFNLKVLEIRDTSPIKSSDGFEDLESLETIIASKYLYCCVKESVECIAPTDQFSDCHDLISNSALRFFMWLLGLSALAGNALVFGMRMVNRCRVGGARRDATPVQTFLITNLAASDFLMGVYMIIIAGADLHFRNNYAFHAEGWRAGLACKIAGVLSILSSEVSVFVIMLLSLDRFFKIVFPFRFGLHLTSRRAQWMVLASWVVGLLMCLLPALVTVYFTHSYYGSSSVCLALPLVPDLPRGWEYMFFLLVVNLICFSIMLICYAAIFVAVKRSSQQSRGSSAQSSAEVRVAAKMALIVGTDFICWMPIIILAILASFGQVAIPQAVYAWIAIFILPLNSSINPYLYTLSNYWGQRKKKKRRAKNSLMLNQGYSPSPINRTRSSALGIDGFNDSQSADFELQPMLKIVLSQLEQHRILPVVRKEPSHLCSPPGGSPNGNICASNQDAGSRNWSLTEHDVTCVVDDVTAALSWLHDNGISGIHLNEDSILLDKDSNGQQRAYLQLPQSILGVDAPTSKLRESSADIGVELDNKALENLIGRLRNNASLVPDEQKTQIDSGQLMTISHL